MQRGNELEFAEWISNIDVLMAKEYIKCHKDFNEYNWFCKFLTDKPPFEVYKDWKEEHESTYN